MKLSVFLFFVTLINIQATTYSQKTKITLNLEDVSVEEVLIKIQSLSEFNFIYNDKEIDFNRVVSVKVKNESIDKILNKIFKDTNTIFSVLDRQILLKLFEEDKLDNPPHIKTIQQDQIEVVGTVTDNDGTPLPGVNVVIEGATKGTQTDFYGNYTIKAEEGEVLRYSYLGMVTMMVTIGKNPTINVTLKEDASQLDEVLVVGYGTQKVNTIVGSISSVKPKELRISSSNLTTALAGRLSGLISYQRSGEPGQDNAQFFVRGVTTFGYKSNPLILIDGVELGTEDLARLSPDDIESFSILKDATATSIYGARGANGIILVTTKEGTEGELKITARIERSVSMPTKNIDFADPITYMQLHNEAVRTRNPIGILPYSPEKIANTIVGTNPLVYPAINWHEELFKDYTTNNKINVNLSGGGKAVRYYLATSFNQDNGILKVDKRNNYNTNINLKKLSVRSNVTIDLTKTTTAVVRFSGTFDDYTGPISGGAGLYKRALKANPVLFPKYFEPDTAHESTNHILFGNYGKDALYLNPYAELVKGYRESTNTLLLSQLEIKQELDFVTEGLSARILVNTTRRSGFSINRLTEPYYYEVGFYDKEANKYSLSVLNNEEGREYLDYNENTPDLFSTFYFESAADYKRTFNEKHDVTALAVFNMSSRLQNNAGNFQNSLPYRNMGVSGRVSYAFDKRYYGEFNFGYNGSERFADNNKFGFFPSAGIGWTVSEEDFFKPLSDVISKLKFRASYGIVGNDAIGSANDRFFYLSQVNLNNDDRGYRFGEDLNFSLSGVSIDRYANSLITWEEAAKFNVGMELNLFDDQLKILADVFSEQRSNILMNRSFIPPSMGLEAAVRANIGEAESNGFEFSIDYNADLGNSWWINSRVNFTYATGKFKVYEEPDFSDTTPWLSKVGQSLSQRTGYIAERLFVDEAEVLNSPIQFGEYGAGDIKYRDINEDGIIDFQDRVAIGFPTSPEIVYGAGFSVGYKNFDASAFFQGQARVSFWIDPIQTSPFIKYVDPPEYDPVSRDHNNALLQVYADNHWSEDNQDVYALWPRLSNTLVENNIKSSTWFMRNGAFVRLKQVEFGYSIPDLLLDRLNLSSVRVYATGTNLFTISEFDLWDVEMGGNGLGYPIQKVFNLGIQISL